MWGTEDIDEIGVYREINDKLGVSIVRFEYKPKGMELERYTLDIEQRRAYLFYKYNNEILRYTVYMNDNDSSLGQKDLDNLLDRYELEDKGQIISIEEYKVEDLEQKRYAAEFEYKDAHYQLVGIIEKNEFEKIIKNLVFL